MKQHLSVSESILLCWASIRNKCKSHFMIFITEFRVWLRRWSSSTAVLCESGQMSDSPAHAYSLTRLTVSGVRVCGADLCDLWAVPMTTGAQRSKANLWETVQNCHVSLCCRRKWVWSGIGTITSNLSWNTNEMSYS